MLKEKLKERNISISKNVEFNTEKEIYIEPNVIIKNNSYIDVKYIGAYTYIGRNVDLQDVLSIGRYTTINNNVSIIKKNNKYTSLTKSKILRTEFKKDFKKLNNNIKKIIKEYKSEETSKIIIGNDVWIGEGVSIKEGVVIGDGVIIESYTKVYEDIEPYSIFVNNETIKRFNKKIIDKLLNLQWWNYELNILEDVNLNSIKEAIEKIAKNIDNNQKVYLPLSNRIFKNELEIKNPILLNFNKNIIAKVKIAKTNLELNINDIHQRNYYFNILNNKKTIDELIMDNFLKNEDVVFDIGANIGYTSLKYIESGAKQVYSFEPVSYVFEKLAKIEEEKIKVFNLALYDKETELNIKLSTKHIQGNTIKKEMVSIFPKVFGENIKEEKIKTTTLDIFCKKNNIFPTFIKIDVEGAEKEVIEGAKETLKTNPPRFLQIEIYDDIFEKVHKEIKKYFKNYKKVIIVETNKLKYMEDISENDKIIETPPTYIYTNEEI
jgi:FkbM family methyltransferase